MSLGDWFDIATMAFVTSQSMDGSAHLSMCFGAGVLRQNRETQSVYICDLVYFPSLLFIFSPLSLSTILVVFLSLIWFSSLLQSRRFIQELSFSSHVLLSEPLPTFHLGLKPSCSISDLTNFYSLMRFYLLHHTTLLQYFLSFYPAASGSPHFYSPSYLTPVIVFTLPSATSFHSLAVAPRSFAPRRVETVKGLNGRKHKNVWKEFKLKPSPLPG